MATAMAKLILYERVQLKRRGRDGFIRRLASMREKAGNDKSLRSQKRKKLLRRCLAATHILKESERL
jgi:hypothetical protein